jgi:metallo-beta-lactamase family protein
MQIKFCGAAREVTGSCHLLSTKTGKILVDCGMFQGSNFNEGKNHDKFPFDPAEIKAVLVTHAHLDHIGRIPKLVKEGFTGPIFMIDATVELARLIWEDAHKIMVEDHEKYGTPILYELSDVAAAKSQSKAVEYHEEMEILPGVKATWKDAGHIFGSAFIEISVERKRIIFSGDIGNENVPILKDTEPAGEADLLICESTYGDRQHESIDTRRSIILNLIKDGVKRGGAVMIPSFALERTQELLYELNLLSEHDHTLPKVPIFLDSPLAVDATKVYNRYPQYFDEEAAKLHLSGDDFFNFPNLDVSYTREESKSINNVRNPKIIIAGAGMMNGGRIIHHALRYLSDPNSTLIIVGYQAEGTLGRRLYEGSEEVSIFGERIKVRCAITAIGALSAHGDQTKLLKWVGEAKKLPKKVYCVHGEPHAATELAHRLEEKFKIEAFVAEYEQEIEV